MTVVTESASDRLSLSTEYGIPIRNLWYMLLYAWNELPLRRIGDLENVEDAPPLDALLAYILMKLTQQRLRIGLGRNYVAEKQLLRGIRGRINFNESLKHRTFERGQAHCEFQRFSINSPKNQIVRSTLVRLIQAGQFGATIQAEELRHNLRWLVRALEGVDLIELKPDFIRRQQLGRNDGDYRLMLAICEMILERQMPTESAGEQRLPALDRDALVLHDVYERFVANFYTVHLPGWSVTPHKHLKWHQKEPSPHLPGMQPDLVLEEKSTGRIVVLDTKFTAASLVTGRWGGESFDSGHLYQVYAYLKTQEHLSDHHRHASGILLYPSVTQQDFSETLELQDLRIRVECVDLTAPWIDIEKHLLDMMLVEPV
jgi:5-methylcytosine-specific restriction enzyme subunit McrC